MLGGGSNLLVSDSGFPGLVLHIAVKGIERDGALFRVGAGENWDDCVEQALGSNCAGVECLAGIPGTVGGTPVQNVGAYGQEVSTVIERVRVFDMVERRFAELAATECGFAYRRSRFNSVDRGRFIVTRVDYRLREGGAPTVRYPDLQRALNAATPDSEPSFAEVAAAVRKIRQSKGMLLVEGDPDCRSAGSFFKNPVVEPKNFSGNEFGARRIALARHYPAGTGSENASRIKIPAAWLIEQTGFAKGYTLGAAGISSRHTLALINRGGARAEEILSLAEKIRAAVEARFGVRLEREPVLVGY